MSIRMNYKSGLLRNKIIKKIKKILPPGDYFHSLGVEAESARLLTAIRRPDLFAKASIAALLHDFAKAMPYERMLDIVSKFSLSVPSRNIINCGFLHGYISAFYAGGFFEIKDGYILTAIKNHTLGRRGMTILDKVIFIADYIEPGRDFSGVEETRMSVYRYIIRENSLDKALLCVMDDKIKSLRFLKIKVDSGFIALRDSLSSRLVS
ncbi:MAG TPA: bis(5'-nucleosyl)-tetraphosphatase (symmetrical) YqeK [Candidatus Wallbacteria bacterium]|nr:bis(5'-nucleosyl)-tetraphosphatase (symmetrical) YqeK [Candidatus Wallbacteria bacterium]